MPEPIGVNPRGVETRYGRKDREVKRVAPQNHARHEREDWDITPRKRAMQRGEEDKKRPRQKSEFVPTCVKCTTKGHYAYECEKTTWCTIPRSWPDWLVQVAKRSRDKAGVAVVMEEKESIAPKPKPSDAKPDRRA